MCVAIPGRIVWIGEHSGPSIPARVRFGSSERDVDLAMVPEAEVGDHVVVHSGFVLRVVPDDEAERVTDLLMTGVW